MREPDPPAPTRRLYSIVVLDSAAKALEKLDKRKQKAIALRIDTLALDPRPQGARKLVGGTNQFRIRVSDYRIVYSVEDRRVLVIVIRIGHRKDVYR